MFINIITPCSRPENLHAISRSINIPRDTYRWIVVFDSEDFPESRLIPSNCEPYVHKDARSTSGNAQRNYAIDKVEKGYLYFNDDDTTVHPDFWSEVSDKTDDFITFTQVWPGGATRITGETVAMSQVDSHNFLVNHEIVKDTRWILNLYEADGHFAVEVFAKAKSFLWIQKVLSTYNSLR
jgi:hypothetical protein